MWVSIFLYHCEEVCVCGCVHVFAMPLLPGLKAYIWLKNRQISLALAQKKKKKRKDKQTNKQKKERKKKKSCFSKITSDIPLSLFLCILSFK